RVHLRHVTRLSPGPRLRGSSGRARALLLQIAPDSGPRPRPRPMTVPGYGRSPAAPRTSDAGTRSEDGSSGLASDRARRTGAPPGASFPWWQPGLRGLQGPARETLLPGLLGDDKCFSKQRLGPFVLAELQVNETEVHQRIRDLPFEADRPSNF